MNSPFYSSLGLGATIIRTLIGYGSIILFVDSIKLLIFPLYDDFLYMYIYTCLFFYSHGFFYTEVDCLKAF
jgi:hypothetical protein